jgi:hypothetical protein
VKPLTRSGPGPGHIPVSADAVLVVVPAACGVPVEESGLTTDDANVR